jgi:hypothetical protein
VHVADEINRLVGRRRVGCLYRGGYFIHRRKLSKIKIKGTSINCHSEHREESLFAFEVNTEMFRFAQHDIFRTILYLFLSFRPTLHSLSRYGLGIDRVSIGY